jgi:hypothetical protein
MLWAKAGLEYIYCPPIERLGLCIVALVPKQSAEIVAGEPNVGMILPENLFVNLDGPPKERLGLGILRQRFPRYASLPRQSRVIEGSAAAASAKLFKLRSRAFWAASWNMRRSLLLPGSH